MFAEIRHEDIGPVPLVENTAAGRRRKPACGSPEPAARRIRLGKRTVQRSRTTLNFDEPISTRPPRISCSGPGLPAPPPGRPSIPILPWCENGCRRDPRHPGDSRRGTGTVAGERRQHQRRTRIDRSQAGHTTRYNATTGVALQLLPGRAERGWASLRLSGERSRSSGVGHGEVAVRGSIGGNPIVKASVTAALTIPMGVGGEVVLEGQSGVAAVPPVFRLLPVR